MVAIGSCDYCGEFCSSLGVNTPEAFELRGGWVPTSAIDRHNDLVERRMACVDFDEGEVGEAHHVGPWHKSNGSRNDECPNCANHSQMDFGIWDATLDHNACTRCWSRVAGFSVLARLRSKARPGHRTPRPASQVVDGSRPHVSTEPADRTRVERAFRSYLGERALLVRWVDSPSGVATALLDAISRGRLDPDHDDGTGFGWSIWTPPGGLPEDALSDIDLADEPAGEVAERIVSLLAGTLAESFPAFADHERALVALIRDAGQFDSRAAALAGDQRRTAFEDLLVELVDSAGPVAVLGDEVVVSERPLVLQLDTRGRPHNEQGPAIAYPDGFAAWALHGVRVPEWLVTHPERVDVGSIDAAVNAEARRVMIERFGVERFVREGGSELVHEDETGRLWRRPVGPDTGLPWRSPASLTSVPPWRRPRGPLREEPIVMVEVLNSTPEADGSRKTYFLRVPPTMTTAREAVAWTFAMDGSAYAPAVES